MRSSISIPGPRAPSRRVIEVAHDGESVLDELGLHAVPKTSGASGLHVVLPLPPGVPNGGARMIAELVATKVAERQPRIATIERSGEGEARRAPSTSTSCRTFAERRWPASTPCARRPQPTVSTPLLWSELTDDLDPLAFTIDTVLPRVRERGDLWGKGMRRANSLERIARRVTEPRCADPPRRQRPSQFSRYLEEIEEALAAVATPCA